MHKIIKDYYLSTVPQKNIITHNIVLVESLRVFEHKTRELGMKNNNNYELFIQDMISRLFPPQVLQNWKRYLHSGLYNTHKTKIRDFIWSIKHIVEYLDHYPPLGND